MPINNKNGVIFGKHKAKLFGVLVTAAVFFLTMAVIVPTIEGIFQTKTNITEKELALSQLSDKEALLKNTGDNKLKLQAQKLNEAIPSVINLPLILSTLQNTAAVSGVTIGDFSIASNVAAVTLIAVDKADKLSSFQFKVGISGSFDNIEQFIRTLGRVTPFLKVVTLDFSQEKSSVTLSFYFQAVDAKTGGEFTLTDLSDKQNEALEKVYQLAPPVIEESIQSSSSGASRTTPFR
ncbi:hypothetical protein HYT17_00290 [Candidatus Microgenomates bacterium]|nr:hypothetical protein [Candidatus Microgenomates bacterium]